ncbi:hypothetical protein Pelo_8340 [Pelomyxa schiedti]|nr:hypothetical protein Pelo_8340 [Pelomyxa schiedti]
MGQAHTAASGPPPPTPNQGTSAAAHNSASVGEARSGRNSESTCASSTEPIIGNCKLLEVIPEGASEGPRLRVTGAPTFDSAFENQNPYVVSVIGDTQCGKSFLVDRPVTGLGDASTTKGVDFFIDSDLAFLDFEGFEARLRPSEREIVEGIYPRIAYSVSSTIVYVTSSSFANISTFSKLLDRLKNTAEIESKEAYKRPNLVIVYNRSTIRDIFTKESNSQRLSECESDPKFGEVRSLFSDISVIFLASEHEPPFEEQRNSIQGILRHHQLPLPSHRWIHLVQAVVNWFNSPQKSEPIPLCKIYASLIDNLEPPLHRVQRLFLSCIPNQSCTEEEFTQSCNLAKRALPVAIALHLHSSNKETTLDLDNYFRKQFTMCIHYLKRFIPCSAHYEEGGIVYRCSVQKRFHSADKHKAYIGEREITWKGEYSPSTFMEDDADLVSLSHKTATIREALSKDDDHLHMSCTNGKWGGADTTLEIQAVLNQFNEINKMNLRNTLKAGSLGATVGCTLGLVYAAPYAIALGLATAGIGIPFSIIILGIAGSAGGVYGGVRLGSADQPECARKELMEGVALLSYANGWNVVVLVDDLTHVTFVTIDT